MIKNIDIDELRDLMFYNNIMILDVRDKAEYIRKKIKGAINISLDRIDEISSICPSRERKIVVYCSKGVRSIVAAERLRELGYTEIYNLTEGIEKILK